MTAPDTPDLPLDLGRDTGSDAAPPRRWLRKRYLLVLLVPVFMFSGAVMGLYYQPPGLQKFYALTGLQPGGGADNPIALPPEIELPEEMAETLLPSDVVGLARLMPRGDVAIVAAPYGSGDARVAEILVSVGDRVSRGDTLARLDNMQALESAVLSAEATLAIRQATLAQTRAQSPRAGPRRRPHWIRHAQHRKRRRPILPGPKDWPDAVSPPRPRLTRPAPQVRKPDWLLLGPRRRWRALLAWRWTISLMSSWPRETWTRRRPSFLACAQTCHAPRCRHPSTARS